MRQIIAERLGYFFNGFTACMGISNKRALDSLTIGLELVDEADVPLVLLQILAGKPGHALQARRALWSLLYISTTCPATQADQGTSAAGRVPPVTSSWHC